jgi:toluene monooxygenase system ferredoxin subunit
VTLPAAASVTPDSGEIVAATGYFLDLTPPQRARIAALGRIEHYRQDGQIYDIGDAAADFYVLVDGMVRFSIGLGNRRAAAGQVLRRGEVFGWAALVEEAPKRIASASCITACTVLAINGDQLLLLMEADHSLGFRLMKQLNSLITGNLTSFASG